MKGEKGGEGSHERSKCEQWKFRCEHEQSIMKMGKKRCAGRGRKGGEEGWRKALRMLTCVYLHCRGQV